MPTGEIFYLVLGRKVTEQGRPQKSYTFYGKFGRGGWQKALKLAKRLRQHGIGDTKIVEHLITNETSIVAIDD